MKTSFVILSLLLCVAVATALETQINLNFKGLIPENFGASSDDDDDDTPPPEPEVEVYFGETIVPVGWGSVSTFVAEIEDTVVAVGLEISRATLEVFPEFFNSHDPSKAPEWVLDFPKEAAPTVFRSFNFGFNPYGHPPPGVFDIAHFDLHWFTASSALINSLTPGFCANYSGSGQNYIVPCDTVATYLEEVDPKYYPAGYVWFNQPVPLMGDHAFDPSDHAVTQPGSFDRTFIFTRYDGYIIGYEPMITLDFLLSRTEDECWDVPRPAAVQFSGKYPTKYCVRLLPERSSIAITMEEFVDRQRS